MARTLRREIRGERAQETRSTTRWDPPEDFCFRGIKIDRDFHVHRYACDAEFYSRAYCHTYICNYWQDDGSGGESGSSSSIMRAPSPPENSAASRILRAETECGGFSYPKAKSPKRMQYLQTDAQYLVSA